MNLTYQEQARFDIVVAHIRRELSYPFEGLLLPPPCWDDQAVLYSTDKQLVVRAGREDEVLLHCRKKANRNSAKQLAFNALVLIINLSN